MIAFGTTTADIPAANDDDTPEGEVQLEDGTIVSAINISGAIPFGTRVLVGAGENGQWFITTVDAR